MKRYLIFLFLFSLSFGQKKPAMLQYDVTDSSATLYPSFVKTKWMDSTRVNTLLALKLNASAVGSIAAKDTSFVSDSVKELISDAMPDTTISRDTLYSESVSKISASGGIAVTKYSKDYNVAPASGRQITTTAEIATLSSALQPADVFQMQDTTNQGITEKVYFENGMLHTWHDSTNTGTTISYIEGTFNGTDKYDTTQITGFHTYDYVFGLSPLAVTPTDTATYPLMAFLDTGRVIVSRKYNGTPNLSYSFGYKSGSLATVTGFDLAQSTPTSLTFTLTSPVTTTASTARSIDSIAICWSATSYPTTIAGAGANVKMIGKATTTDSLTDLVANTLYYVTPIAQTYAHEELAGTGDTCTTNSAGVEHYVQFTSYAGNDEYGRKITGLQFVPDYVLIKPSTAVYPTIKTSTMGADSAYQMSTSKVLNDSLITIGADSSITIGILSELNTSGVTYHVKLMREKSGSIKLLHYMGNATHRYLTDLGFTDTVAYAWVHGNQTAAYAIDAIRILGMPADSTLSSASGSPTANIFEYFAVDTIYVGSSSYANQNTIEYHGIALAREAAHIVPYNYIGNSVDNTDIVFTPSQFDWFEVYQKGTQIPIFRSSTEASNYTINFKNGEEQTTGLLIKQINADGFRVGTSAITNGLGYYYVTLGLLAW
jgi:hypothetical protein